MAGHCVTVRTPTGSAILCGVPTRRICDVCDRTASGPPEHLKNGQRFDVCASCRAGIEVVRMLVAGPGDEEDAAIEEWGRLAGERVLEALAGLRG